MVLRHTRFLFLHFRSSTLRNPFGSNLNHVRRSSVTSSAFVSGHSRDAHNLFDNMIERDSQTWNAVIWSYSLNGRHEEALSLFQQRVQCPRTHRPDHQAFAAVLKSCAALLLIELGRTFHGYGIKLGYELNQAVSKALMNMYAKCRAFPDCCQLFHQMGHGDPVMWNILLSGYAGAQVYDIKVVQLFYAMHVSEKEPKPNAITVAIILPVCARSRDLEPGKSVHAYVIKSGFESDTLVGNALVSMYAKCNCVWNGACATFRGIAYKDAVSWNAMIGGFTENGLFADAFGLFRRMLTGPTQPNCTTIANVLPICAFLEHDGAYHFGKEIHCYVLRRFELVEDVSVSNALVSFYSRIGQLEVAESVFQRMKSKDLVSWNAVIAGYASNGRSFKAVKLFHELLSAEMVGPDSVTLITVLPVCAQLGNLLEGRKIHEYVLRHPRLREDTAIGNALISFYANFGYVEAAMWTFLMIPRRDLISWNAMLDAYAESGCATQVVNLLQQMLKEGMRPDYITILTILRVCATVSNGEKVKEVHGYSVRAGLLPSDLEPTVGNMILDAYSKCEDMGCALKIFESLSGRRNVVTGNSMISGYVNCGSWKDAETIFNKMTQTDLTTWNLMVRVYAENNFPDQALSLFHELQARIRRPDAMSVMSLLPVCARLASVHMVRQCHGFVVRACFEDVHLKGALLDVYTKCGSINCAYKLFQSNPQKDLVMFTAMVSGFAMHGRGEEALRVFYHMLDLGIEPDHVIIIAVLSACSHAGLMDEGWKLFESIEKVHRIKPTMEHYACLVDLLARGGRLKDAYSFVTKMPIEPNASIWGTLLGACRTHHEVELGRLVADHLFDVETTNIGNYVVMSNIYAADAQWDGVKEMRTLMRTRDLRKPAGCSWIEVGRKRSVFVTEDSSHPLRSIIYSTLSTLEQQIKEPVCV